MGTSSKTERDRKREMDETTHYMAHMHTKSQPPHFRPIMIIVVVLSLGMFITGLVLTIVAYRPGHSAMGSDPLKIVGPVLLSIGGVIFILCMVDICRRISRDNHRMQRSYAAMQAGPNQAPSMSSHQHHHQQQQHYYSHNNSMQSRGSYRLPSQGSMRLPSQGSMRLPSQSSVHNESQSQSQSQETPVKTVTVKADRNTSM